MCVNTADKEDFTGLRKRGKNLDHHPKYAAAATAGAAAVVVVVVVVGVGVGVVAAGWTGLLL